MTRSFFLTCFLSLANFATSVHADPSKGKTEVSVTDFPNLKKVMIIVFENVDYKDAEARPFFAQVAKDGALLSEFYAEVHPSQANYIALTSGSLNGVVGDANHDIDALNMVDLLETKGKTWKVYAESFPGHCFLDAVSGTYVRKHNPFISYRNIQRNPARCKNIVDASELDHDIEAGTLPDYSFYVPDINNDGHDTGVSFADTWFAKAFGPRLKDPRFINDLTLAITFDESSLSGGNHIYTALCGNGIRPGSVNNTHYNHFNLLKTIEVGMGLGSLTSQDTNAEVIKGIWK